MAKWAAVVACAVGAMVVGVVLAVWAGQALEPSQWLRAAFAPGAYHTYEGTVALTGILGLAMVVGIAIVCLRAAFRCRRG